MSKSTPAALPRRARFKPYPEYRDSGVEWLGEVPVHWGDARLSKLTTLLNGYPFDSGYFVRGEGVPLVRIRDLNAIETEVNYVGPVVPTAWIEPGDVIVGMDGDFNVARWRGQQALLNQRMCCLRPRDRTDSRFIAYMIPLPLRVINDLTYSTTVKHLSSAIVRNTRFGAPPELEQRAIADFLDRETARIDALVAKKERLVELLQEKRTALITRAVTKGLDPNVPMRDSGVEWLGSIPKHWRLWRLKHVSSGLTVGVVVNPSQYVSPSGVPFLRGVDITEGRIDLAHAQFMSDEAVRLHRKSTLRAGDLVSIRVGYPGVTAVVPAELDGSNCASLLITRRSDRIDSQLLCFLMNSAVGKAQFRLLQDGAAQEQINVSDAVDFLVPVPPKGEQAAIVELLRAETAHIDTLIAKVREGIGLLKEYRTALISAAVTGKIDLRESVA